MGDNLVNGNASSGPTRSLDSSSVNKNSVAPSSIATKHSGTNILGESLRQQDDTPNNRDLQLAANPNKFHKISVNSESSTVASDGDRQINTRWAVSRTNTDDSKKLSRLKLPIPVVRRGSSSYDDSSPGLSSYMASPPSSEVSPPCYHHINRLNEEDDNIDDSPTKAEFRMVMNEESDP